MSNPSTGTVWVSLAADLAVALAKVGVAALTGSPAMAAEASHSLTDTANDLFLVIAQRRSTRHPDEQHRLGYGREAYFWALMAALGVFIAGAAFSLREGIAELIHPVGTSSFSVAYIVLAISGVFDLVSARQSIHQMSTEARQANRNLLEQTRFTSDPALRAVFLQDAVSVSGDLIALVALALNQITGSSVYQGVAAVLIALLLIRVSLRLVGRNHDFLLGQAVTPTDMARVRMFLLGYPGVTAIAELIVTYIGPEQVWVIARIDIDDDLRGEHVKSLLRSIESDMKKESGAIYRVDIVPIGEAQSAPGAVQEASEHAKVQDRGSVLRTSRCCFRNG